MRASSRLRNRALPNEHTQRTYPENNSRRSLRRHSTPSPPTSHTPPLQRHRPTHRSVPDSIRCQHLGPKSSLKSNLLLHRPLLCFVRFLCLYLNFIIYAFIFMQEVIGLHIFITTHPPVSHILLFTHIPIHTQAR